MDIGKHQTGVSELGTNMKEKVNQKVSVVTVFSAKQRAVAPYLLSWQNIDYHVGKIGYHHTIWHGKTLHHIYELVDKDERLHFRLNLNTSNLHWTLEAVSDGLAD